MAGVSLENRVNMPLVSMTHHCMRIGKGVVDILKIVDGDILLIDSFDGGLFIAVKPLTASKKVGALMRDVNDSGSMKGYSYSVMKDIELGLYSIDSEPMYKGGIDWFEITRITEENDEG